MTDIAIPEDTARSRLAPTAPKGDALDDVATVGERIEAFWEKYPEGSILTEVESEQAGEYVVFTVRAFIRRKGESERPDTTAHATRGSYDPEPIVAQFPQETAETSAISRALRNLGILAVPRPAAPVPAPVAAPTGAPRPPAPSALSAVALGRQMHELTQVDLARAMREAGHPWTQAIVSKVERDKRAVTDAEAETLSKLIGYRAP